MSSKSRYPHTFICTQFRSGVLQPQQVRGRRMWITSCFRAGQQEVTRSNVKCMYCNKHVQLKASTGYFIGVLGLVYTLVPC